LQSEQDRDGENERDDCACRQQLLALPDRADAIDGHDATLGTDAMRSATVKRRSECETFYGYYVGDADPADELVSPLLADDLSEPPRATIITAEHDTLRDDGLASSNL
jgi:acetyl esterase/lipase